MKHNILKIFLTTIFIGISFNTAIAQENVSDIVGGEQEDETISELEQKEEEREQQFLDELLLSIPELTDNPSHIITFVDPSEAKEGVQIEIDSKSFQEIKSPYTLPALSIGNHELRFKFVDKYGSTQILEKEIVIIPRPPIISSPIFEESSLKVSGTALSNSELILILSSSRDIVVFNEEINGDGSWEVTIENTELTEGIYTFTAYTRKYGYASNLAEPVTFQVGESQTILLDNNRSGFNILSIFDEETGEKLKNNLDIVIVIAIAFVLGGIIMSVIVTLLRNRKEGTSLKSMEDRIVNHNKDEKTLFEKLSGEKDVKQKEKKKPEKIVTKIDFLKDYKKFDPDNEKGEEKKDVKVTLIDKKK